MWLAVVGLILAALKFFEVAPVAAWSWWWIAVPFIGAFIYWEIVDDFLHITKKREARRMDAKKDKRTEDLRRSLNLENRKKR